MQGTGRKSPQATASERTEETRKVTKEGERGSCTRLRIPERGESGKEEVECVTLCTRRKGEKVSGDGKEEQNVRI